MQDKTTFLGIDISKQHFDLAIVDCSGKHVHNHKRFNNNTFGFTQMRKWLGKQNLPAASTWLFCMEHTGVYGYHLCCFLEEQGWDYCRESGYKISRSLGMIKRSKTDKADAADIAHFARRHVDELKLFRLPSATVQKLKGLLAYRRRLVKQKAALMTAGKESADNSIAMVKDFVQENSKELIDLYSKQIEKVMTQIDELIASDSKLEKQCKLVGSVTGIGPVITCYLLTRTNCFEWFDNARQFACYCGSAPFERSSGTSIKKRVHVSQMADKELKSLLTNAAYAAIRYDVELRKYYERKIEEGKAPFSVINAIRNKLIHRVFATVKRGTPYVKVAQC